MKEFINKGKSNKKAIIALASLILIGVVGVTAAVIYFKSEIENEFSTSAYNVSIEEEFYDDWGTKKVSIVNHDTTPVVIRVSYNELWSQQGEITNSTSCKVATMELEDGYMFTLSNKVNGKEVVTKDWTDSWKNEFILGSDGWYYYKKVLSETNNTVQILNSITLNKELIKASSCYQNYNDYDYNLDFNYEAIQATEEAVKEIWGHSITISDGNITWPF